VEDPKLNDAPANPPNQTLTEPPTRETRSNPKPQTPRVRHSFSDGGNPKLQLESAITARRRSQTELSNLEKCLAEKSARQAALETTGNLKDAAVLAEIGTLQILTSLLPRRIAAKKQDDMDAEKALTHATNQFIREHLGPRIRHLAARTRTIVEAELSSHFRDPAALIQAVAGSERIHHIASMNYSVSLTPARGALDHAQSALKAWTAANTFENDLEPTRTPVGRASSRAAHDSKPSHLPNA
jgi:hypothetical protein